MFNLVNFFTSYENLKVIIYLKNHIRVLKVQLVSGAHKIITSGKCIIEIDNICICESDNYTICITTLKVRFS